MTSQNIGFLVSQGIFAKVTSQNKQIGDVIKQTQNG